MDFPQRTYTHIYEKESLDILSTTLPKEWIIRDFTERDYGIDLYIEIVEKDGYVTGNLLALHITSSKNIELKSDNSHLHSKIKRSTLNYWKVLPITVFMILVDLEIKTCFWCNIKNEIS
jgi:hypothetical protein